MDADTSTFTPRLRMSRNSPVQYDRSSNLASTSEAGPSRLPNFSQILDLDMKDISDSDDQFYSSEINTPKITTTPTTTRSDNPAAVLRALLSRLPAHPPSPTQSHDLSVQGGTERESDFDTVSESNAAPSIAQESVKHIFSKALRDPGNTPQKARRRRNSIDASEVEASPRVEKERATNKGKRRSVSDDEVENNTSQSIDHRGIRLKTTSQPVTVEFLRERFSDSHNLRKSIEPQRSPTISSHHDSSNDTATILRDLNSSQLTPPAATSTPQQSLRLSTSSRFQLHSNLLDQDSEMQKVIEGPDSYDESIIHGQTSTTRAFNSSKTLQMSPVLPHQSSKSNFKPKSTLPSSQKSTGDRSHSMDYLRTPSQQELFHVDPARSPSPAPQLNSHHNKNNVNLDSSSRTKPSKDKSSVSHSERHLRSEVHSTSVMFPLSTSSRLSPLPRTENYRHNSPSSRTNSSAGSLRNQDDDYVDVVYERQRNWNSPRPTWHKPPPLPNLPQGRDASPSFSPSAHSPPPTVKDRIRTNSFRTSKHLNEHHHDHHSHTDASHTSKPTTTREREQTSRPLEQSSPTPSRTSSLQAINNTYNTNNPSLQDASRSPSPSLSFSKERNGLPSTREKTPASSRKQGTHQEQDYSSSSNINAATPVQKSNSRERHLTRRDSALQLIKTTEPTSTRNEDTVHDRDMESDGLRETDFSSQGETSDPRVATSGSGTPLDSDGPPQENGMGNILDHTAQTDITTLPLTPTRNKASRSSRRNEFKSPSPPKGLPELPTPSSSDESNRDSPRSNRSHRDIQPGLKWMATPKPPGGWLNTPKPSREVMEQGSPSDNVTQSDNDTPLATDDGLSYMKTPARAEATHGSHSFSKTPKPPGGWVSTPAPAPALVPAQSVSVDSPLDTPERNQGLLTPVASFSKGSKLEPKTPAAPGAWLATPAAKKSILKVRFEPEVSTLADKSTESAKNLDPSFDSNISAINGLDTGDDGLQRTEQQSLKSPSSPRRQKSPKSPKIRVLDAFGREQEPDVSNRESTNGSPSPARIVDVMGHETDEGTHMEGIEGAAAPSYSTSSRGELLSRIRNGLDDLTVDIDDFEKDNQALSIDHDRVRQLTSISRRARGLREKLHSQANSSRSFLSGTLDTKTSWFSANAKIYIFLTILQLSLIWLIYRMSIRWAQELWLNRYYDPFNPELHLYIFKSEASLHVPRSEGARTTMWFSLVGHIWDKGIHFIGSMQFRFWRVWDKGVALQYDNAWTPT